MPYYYISPYHQLDGIDTLRYIPKMGWIINETDDSAFKEYETGVNSLLYRFIDYPDSMPLPVLLRSRQTKYSLGIGEVSRGVPIRRVQNWSFNMQELRMISAAFGQLYDFAEEAGIRPNRDSFYIDCEDVDKFQYMIKLLIASNHNPFGQLTDSRTRRRFKVLYEPIIILSDNDTPRLIEQFLNSYHRGANND